jgi:hypothetical protein
MYFFFFLLDWFSKVQNVYLFIHQVYDVNPTGLYSEVEKLNLRLSQHRIHVFYVNQMDTLYLSCL